MDTALDKLKEYSKKYQVEQVIQPIKSDIATFSIRPNTYELIVVVSALEHVTSADEMMNVLRHMEKGTKLGGINCLIVHSEVKEIDIETNKNLDPYIEVNLPTDDMLNRLRRVYHGWKERKVLVKPLTYHIMRNGKTIALKTNAITYVTQK